jgi:hypothetical protein
MREVVMKSLRQGIAIAFALAMVAGSISTARAAGGADSAAVTPVAQGPSWAFEGTGSWHNVDHPFFGQSGHDSRDDWGEGFSRLRLNYGCPDGLWGSVGGVVMATAGTDYYGTHDKNDGMLDQLEVGASNIGGTGVNLVVGRQDIILGDGFLIGDGYVDRRAALWNIPLNFYDGVLASWKRGKAHVLAFGVNLSHSIGSGDAYPSGEVFGGEVGMAPAEGADVSLAVIQAHDTNDATNLNPAAYSLRATYPFGTATLSGEAVLESGTIGSSDLAGKGGHVKFSAPIKAKWSPVATAEYFYFSGDDPATTKNEGYFPWQFRWSDWSQYYVGDLLASTVGTSSNKSILRAQLGVTPREGTQVRLLAHRFDLAKTLTPGLLQSNTLAFAYEFDAVVDQSFGSHWSAWLMGGIAPPLDRAKAAYGDKNSAQLFASVSWKFGGPVGGGE